MHSTVPDEFRELYEAFPGLSLFDAEGKPNPYGKMAQELMIKRKLLEEAKFFLNSEDGMLHCVVADIPVPPETIIDSLPDIANAFLQEHGVPRGIPVIKGF